MRDVQRRLERHARCGDLQRRRTRGHWTVVRQRSLGSGAARRGWSERGSSAGGDSARLAVALGRQRSGARRPQIAAASGGGAEFPPGCGGTTAQGGRRRRQPSRHCPRDRRGQGRPVACPAALASAAAMRRHVALRRTGHPTRPHTGCAWRRRRGGVAAHRVWTLRPPRRLTLRAAA